MPFAVELEAVGVRKLAWRGAFVPPGELESPVGVEHLHAMVRGVGNPDAAAGVGVEPLRPHELARLIAVASPLQQELAVVRELLNSIVFAILADIVAAVRAFDG